ncbi:hypothetical protein [Dehalogenimonas etheniformans]|uniref:Uncharacterized protein n=1 Tax=Dehalogenimonas etheniformans TaxID=1536648 RepID=A0A2P5P9J7_9CHLR|nr:hypothetical protein [Dehalogenimonas etheniformans]PPD58971.1 hypothetical protein JP09_003685 [Dehalogenimonas etheniformans]QNT76262.1 hypothetical protein HX448_05945 [Dehalogenimonas etheniformans]
MERKKKITRNLTDRQLKVEKLVDEHAALKALMVKLQDELDHAAGEDTNLKTRLSATLARTEGRIQDIGEELNRVGSAKE